MSRARSWPRIAASTLSLAGLALWPWRASVAGLSVDRVPELSPCAEASTYLDTDGSPEAERARRRCRLEQLEQRKAYERQWTAWVENQRREQAVQAWRERTGIPTRTTRRNSIDGFLATGVSHYGLTLAGVLVPALEAEAWVGFGNGDHGSFNGALHDDRRCLGGRAKWLPVERGNVTPYFAAGAAGCTASLQFYDYSQGGFGTSSGSGVAHALTGSVGLTWMATVGVRLSLEYIFAWAFYVQASQSTGAHAHDPAMRSAFDSAMADDRHGIRMQVGYAF